MTVSGAVVLLNQLREAERKIQALSKKIDIIKIMMSQFQLQCNQLPEGDHVRTIIETFIKATLQATEDIVEEPPRIIVV